MTALTWHATRQDFAKQYGEYPGPTIETDLIDIFEVAPSTVIHTLTDCADLKANGTITSAWAVAHNRLTRRKDPIRDVTVDTSKDRAKRIANAEAWMKRAGFQYPTEDEAWDELSNGILKDHHDLELRMRALYHETRPAGEALEQEAEERATHWKKSHTCPDCKKLNPFATRTCPCPERKARLLEEAQAQIDAEANTPKPEPEDAGPPPDDWLDT